MDDELLTKPKILRRVNGIGGDHDEMLANLELSMKLGDFARASNLINRLRDEFHPVGSKAYLDYHNKLLQSMVSHAIQKRDLDLARQAQRWFEVDMPYGGVEADPTTFATMIRMALRLFYGPKRDRAVRRYWGLAKGKECEELVLSVPVLSEVELGELSEVRSPLHSFLIFSLTYSL
jgi:DNA-directed RNA polymerase